MATSNPSEKETQYENESSVLPKVFTSDIYKDLDVKYLVKLTEFRKLLTFYELQTLEVTLNPEDPNLLPVPKSHHVKSTFPSTPSYSHVQSQAQTELLKPPFSRNTGPVIKKERYKMNTSPRGLAFVINNVKFVHMENRDGSDEDKKHLRKLFDYLDFSVAYENNRTAKEMIEDLQKFAEHPKLKEVSAIFVVILTHGFQRHVLFGKDGEMTKTGPKAGTYVTLPDIHQIFDATSCPDMKDHPKGFILQACRGWNEDLKVTEEKSSKSMKSKHWVGPLDPATGKGNVTGTAVTADYLDVFACSSGFKAYRQPKTGSPFIMQLCSHIIKYAANEHFEDIFKNLQKTFNKPLDNSDIIMMPDTAGIMPNYWYFNPPHPLPSQ